MKNKAPKQRRPGMSKTKKIVLSLVSLVLVTAIGLGTWYYLGHRQSDPVFVYNFMSIGMTEYWGDSKESYGPVTTDKIQTVFLSNTQTVTEVYVELGSTVKKGDPLMAFDTTLTDLALERERLGVEKLKLQLEDAEEELTRIKNMRPMTIVNPAPNPPAPSDQGTPLSGDYQIVSRPASDGSTAQKALVCWIGGGVSIDNGLLEALRLKAEELYNENLASQPPAGTGDPGQSQDPAEGTAPTEPGTEPTQEPSDPPHTEVNHFFVIFKTTEQDMSKGETLTWQGMEITLTEGGFGFTFFDASNVPDISAPVVEDPGNSGPSIDYGSGYTASEIANMRTEQEKTIKDLKFQIKMAEANYKIKQTEATDGKIYAQIDGTVVSLLTPDEALDTQQPMLKLSGGGGFYVEGTVSELDKDALQIGQQVDINDWNTGMVYTGTIEEIGTYPADGSNYNGTGNPNASYYPFKVFVDESADLQEGSYVSIMYSAGQTSENGIYLENPFIRTENGQSYVYVQGEDGKLEKRFVTTGKALWGSYTEILSGISETDMIAFPYGKNVKEGAETQPGDMSDLYGY